MYILHGENIVQSRTRLTGLINQAKKTGQTVVRLEAKQLDLPTLETTFGAQSLFGEARLIVIEELHSLPKSKKKDELIASLARLATGQSVVIWEKRALTPTMLKKFVGAKVEEFKLTNTLFKWLDSLSGQAEVTARQAQLQTLRQAIASDGEMMCLFMLARQIRLLLQAHEGNLAGLAPFMIGKLKKQAYSFTVTQLLTLHHQLLQLDTQQKTTPGRLSLGQELEVLALKQ